MKRDPYKHKERFEKWLASVANCRQIDGLSKINTRLFLSFIQDSRLGLNISHSSKKGERSFIRLNTMRGKLAFVLKTMQERGVFDIRNVTANELHNLFSDMRSGILCTRFNTPYKSTGDYVKDFKTFWHWYQKIMQKEGKIIPDITEDLDSRGEKPKFVYFTQNDFEQVMAQASYDTKPIVALAYDSGARVTELLNVRVSDFTHDYSELNIRDEVSKTFGRRIKLMLCTNQIREFVNKYGLSNNEYVFQKSLVEINHELREIARKVFSPEQIKYKNLTLKDFRHSSACFWLPRYKSESAMKYRFGWKKTDMIHYYTEFLGMKDTITQDDMYVDITKTELEKEVDRLRNDIHILKESVRELIAVAKERSIV